MIGESADFTNTGGWNGEGLFKEEYVQWLSKSKCKTRNRSIFMLQPSKDELCYRFDNNLWTTDAGKVIPLSNMVDEHLFNALRHAKRSRDKTACYGLAKAWVPKLQNEIRKRFKLL